MHGEVKVLKNLSGWKISNLYQLPVSSEGDKEAMVARCKAWCYSSILCEYWQFGNGGCWVDAPLWTTSRGEFPEKRVKYPLVNSPDGGATNEGADAASMVVGEYIQHYCPEGENTESGDTPETTPPDVQSPALGAAPAPLGQAEESWPWWKWAVLCGSCCTCIAVCGFLACQRMRGQKRNTRGLARLSQYDEDSPLMDRRGAPRANSFDSSDEGDFDGVPPPPPWYPPDDVAVQPKQQQPRGGSEGAQGPQTTGWTQSFATSGPDFRQGQFFTPMTQRLDFSTPPTPGPQIMSAYGQYGFVPATHHAGAAPFHRPAPGYYGWWS